jgi:hypothetical protein
VARPAGRGWLVFGRRRAPPTGDGAGDGSDDGAIL